MEPNDLHGGLLSGIGSGMLGLEMQLHPQQQNPQNPQNPHHLHHQSQMVYTDHHHTQPQQSVKQHGYLFNPKPKQLHSHSPVSDDDELGFTPDVSNGDGKRKTSSSPWQRMKWTDGMVRLLIAAVFYIGDEAGYEGNDKKKSGALLQKKGKWKSVSRAMMEKDFYVSPQQCEDKFNDLNKRYKRVNEILGKGTACRVVENQSLLDAMDLPPKTKEEVKKLLNSKHLFFREMCAYHNSCGHVGAGASGATTTGANHSPEVATTATDPSPVQHQQLRLSENAHIGANSSRTATEGTPILKVGSEDSDEDDEDDSDDDEDDDFDDEISRGQNGHVQEDDDDNDGHKRRRKGAFPVSPSPLMQQLNSEVTTVIQDGSKSAWEKKQWIKTRILQLEEQQVSFQYQAFELEKQRLKWVRFSTKKEREMERAKLENERKRLENERMGLDLRQKELQLLDLHHHHQQQHSSNNKRSDPSSVTG